MVISSTFVKVLRLYFIQMVMGVIKKIFAATILVLTLSTAWGQENIQDQFNTFYDKETNTWQEYRMMKMPKLKEFWEVVSDTLALKDQSIKSGLEQVAKLEADVKSRDTRIAELETQLTESMSLNDSISFIGMNMSKIAYTIIVWSIIVALAVAVIVVYLMFMRSNVVTKKVQKAYNSLETEYAEHRDRARESQVKLKRELQTALNTLHENRINL
ncbi:hypothetical protein [Reichenbachiella versicolor]|uniref:hypothetical protein n=1 Tax=Reichenbachiella versicolor TaxID=1821036 RepID=UPI000D6DD56F|nr:hypothetical protein [Reichenbachiella versicolor]